MIDSTDHKIFVVTPAYRPETKYLTKCCESVEGQSVGPVHHIIVNDGGPAFSLPKDSNAEIINLPTNHNDYGDTPRWEGIEEAFRQGATCIAMLDDDNWFEPDHIANALKLNRDENAAFVASKRKMVDLDGNYIGVCATSGSDGRFADTSAVVYFKPVFDVLDKWGTMETWQHAIADRVMWKTLKDTELDFELSQAPTLNYRCTHKFLYREYGLVPPKGAKNDTNVDAALARWKQETGEDLHFKHELEKES